VVSPRIRSVFQASAFVLFALTPLSLKAQFSGNIQGIIQDPSGAVVAKANLTLLNTATQVRRETASDENGQYKFTSLAPGTYKLSATASGFANAEVNTTLETSQTLNLPISLAVAGTTQAVEVTGQTPIVNTAETRNQLTLETKTLSSLPLAGRNMISLVTLAPGVSGTGTAAGGSPGSGVDNYSTETQVDASANGQGSVGNMFVVDGLDITSAIRPGVLNLTPNPDSIQETSIQSNTFTVDYGRATSIQMVMTTKSGGDQFHGNVSDYFTNQHLWAGTEFVHNYAPFHSNNMSASIGGPIIPHHEFFFFGSVEPLWSSNSTGNGQTTFEDPAFTNWASQNYPNTIGTRLLTSYRPTGGTVTGVSATAAQLFPGTCGTAATGNLPCSLPVVDTGVFNSTSYRNGLQWNVRVDKYFKSDRIYGTFYKTNLSYGNSTIRPAFTTTNETYQHAVQVNETHTFSPTTLNEAAFGANYIEGITPKTGLFSVPVVNVTGLGQGFGAGFAGGDFIQHNYHWRDVLTHISGAHNYKFGYEGWFGDDVEKFQGPYSQPTFTFNNLVDLVQDNPYTESGIAYNPLTGKQTLWDWNAAGSTWGLFFQDTWQVTKRLTINYGLRWDDFGNAYSRSPQTVFANLYMAPSNNMIGRIANAVMRQNSNALDSSITNVFSPRVGVAWDPTGKGSWVVRGGVGVYHNWPTLANIQEQYRGNPPGLIIPTFYSTGTGVPPLLSFGDNNTTPPFGFSYPSLPPSQLDAHGGIVGLNNSVGAIDPTLSAPIVYNWAASVERKISRNYAVSVGYTGSRGNRLLSGGGQVANVSYGADINAYAGDLIQHNSLVPTRLNPSFGSIFYTANDRESRYNAFIASFNGRFSDRGFINFSYTRSASRDDTQIYPSAYNPQRWYGPSIWDVPNRFSLTANYQIPGLHQGHGIVGHFTSGWSLTGTAIVQSGTPFTVFTNAPFNPLKNAAGQFIGYAPGSGDFNADGNNMDYPDVVSYQQSTSRQAFLNGLFDKSNFPNPAFGSNGNQKYGQFRNPMFFNADASLLKDTAITERVKLQLRFEFFNVFNRANLYNVDSNLASGTFGKATQQYNPRWIQLGANLQF
jgi:hypothetical protein